MVTVTCIDKKCGVPFGIPEHIEAQARRDPQRSIICPNGHSFVYVDSEPDRLRKRIADLEEDIARWKRVNENEERRTALQMRRAAYWKGIATRRARAATR
jgi:hypothetical protein